MELVNGAFPRDFPRGRRRAAAADQGDADGRRAVLLGGGPRLIRGAALQRRTVLCACYRMNVQSMRTKVHEPQELENRARHRRHRGHRPLSVALDLGGARPPRVRHGPQRGRAGRARAKKAQRAAWRSRRVRSTSTSPDSIAAADSERCDARTDGHGVDVIVNNAGYGQGGALMERQRRGAARAVRYQRLRADGGDARIPARDARARPRLDRERRAA